MEYAMDLMDLTERTRTSPFTLLELQPPIAVVTLNRPQALNAINQAILDDLERIFSAIRGESGGESGIRAVLLTGSGEKAFSVGADIAELLRISSIEGERLALRGQRVFSLIENCGRPVIACINGYALGGGCELALACTLRIASENARLGQPEVKIGLAPGYGGTQRLPRLIGKGAALKMLLTGEPVTAAEALRMGLVEEVAPAGELLARGERLARVIAANAPLAVRESIRAVISGCDLPLENALAQEASLFGLLCSTDDKAEGTLAFLEKRPAQWTGK